MPRCDEDFIQEIVSLGGHIEFISALILPTGSHFDLDYTFTRLAAIMRMVGFDNCVISSDAGGVFMGLWPHEQLRMFGQGLMGAGIAEDDVRKMMSTNPASLVRLEDV
jgi:microsomal dipeptidase-like Zn-dependent dipeptidase